MPKKKKKVLQSSVILDPTLSAALHAAEFDSKSWLFWIFVKSTILAIGLVLATFIIGLAIFAYAYSNAVARHAGLSLGSLYGLAAKGWSTEVAQTQGKKNILVLGIDSLSTRNNEDINTDTIMVASVNLNRGAVTTFSLPRDLFLTDAKIKINAIYAREVRGGSQNPELATKTVVENLAGIPIHHVVVLEIQEVGKLIDALGGIEVKVERSFTDEKFPRDSMDLADEKTPNFLYKTITFTAGVEHMNGERALQFIRSRHSTDPIEGSDDARGRRQQLIIEALIAKLLNQNIIKHPGFIGDLIKLYESDFQKYLPLEEVIGMGKIFLKLGHLPTFTGKHFAIKGFEEGPVLYHPDKFYTKQWVYLLIDPTGKQLKAIVAEWLK